MSRFDYVAYDDIAKAQQARLKAKVENIVLDIEALGPSRPVSLAITAIEEAYMWIGKAIRDEQINRNGSAELEEQRSNS